MTKLYSRTGEEISAAFPDLLDALDFDGAIDGELLILREGRVQSFNVLQQRLNRKAISGALLADFPAHIRAYDLLAEEGEDLRDLPFTARRARLEARMAANANPKLDLSALIPFASWEELTAIRADPASHGAGVDAEAVEGVMIKRLDSPYLPGRPKGPWWKWKRDPRLVDAVLMYAQRGSGKRSSFHSDFTFGVWQEEAGAQRLVPVGKAYFGFTDAELQELDRYVRKNTVGPLRPGPGGAGRRRAGAGSGGGLRGHRALAAPQVRRGDALPPDLPHPLGQAAPRGGPPGDADQDAGGVVAPLSLTDERYSAGLKSSATPLMQ